LETGIPHEARHLGKTARERGDKKWAKKAALDQAKTKVEVMKKELVQGGERKREERKDDTRFDSVEDGDKPPSTRSGANNSSGRKRGGEGKRSIEKKNHGD